MLTQYTVSLWGDEAFSAVLSNNSIPKILEIISRDTSPPLYNITEHYWFQLFGSGEVAIRALSTLYYLIAVFFVYQTGKFLFSRSAGLLAAVLTFTNPFLFIYMFEGRMYSILAAGVTASMYFFARMIFTKGKKVSKIDLVGYTLATAWALYSHHFAIFALVIQGLWLIWEFVRGRRKIAISLFFSFIAVGVLYLPWLPALYNQTKLVGTGFWLGTPTLADLRGLIQKYLAEGQVSSLSRPALYLVYIALAVRAWNRDVKKSAFLLSWFMGPIILAFIVSQKYTSIFYDRYLIYAIPAIGLLLASNGRKVAGIALAILFPLFLLIDYNYFINPTKLPFRDLAAYTNENVKGDDYLINWNSASHHLWETKYYGVVAPLFVPRGSELPFYVGTAQMTKDDIVNEIPNKLGTQFNTQVKVRRVGVITSGPPEEVQIAGYKQKEIKEFGNLKFIWLD